MKVLRLLANTIVASILKSALDTTLAGPFIAWEMSILAEMKDHDRAKAPIRAAANPYRMSNELAGMQSKLAEPSFAAVGKDLWRYWSCDHFQLYRCRWSYP